MAVCLPETLPQFLKHSELISVPLPLPVLPSLAGDWGPSTVDTAAPPKGSPMPHLPCLCNPSHRTPAPQACEKSQCPRGASESRSGFSVCLLPPRMCDLCHWRPGLRQVEAGAPASPGRWQAARVSRQEGGCAARGHRSS